MTRMRMTKEEVKEDYKQSEGDPHIEGAPAPVAPRAARRRMMQAVPEATVVVMNPTHYAVALKYEQGEHAAPMCVAKGLDTLALKIRAVAEEAGVPVIEDPPLARALYAAVDIEEMIPPAHFEAVAKIIGFIMALGPQARSSPLKRGPLKPGLSLNPVPPHLDALGCDTNADQRFAGGADARHGRAVQDPQGQTR